MNSDRDESWREDALCQQVGWQPFFPSKGGDNGAAAKRVCASCPVQAQCLEYAIVTFQRHGIWGGKSDGDFRKIRKRRGIVEPAPEPEAGAAVTAEEARYLLAFGMALPAVAKQLGVSVEWIKLLLGGGKRAAA